MQTDLPVVVMAKPVGSRCNMRCSYCYYLGKGQFSSHEVQSVMTLELLEKLVKETAEAASGPTVSFVWHGGEPTLAGIPFFRKALQFERRYLRPGQQAWNNLQTNGILIDDEWGAFLSRQHFDVGVSIDGNALVHNTNRHLLGGQDSHEKVVQGIKTLKKYGITPDLLCTVNSETVKHPLDVYRFLRDLKTGWIQFIPILVREGDGMSKESVTPEDYGDFLIAVFDEWVTHDLGISDVQIIAECAHILSGQPAALCWMAETCGRVLIAEEDGAIYACDHFVDDDHRLGMLQDSVLIDMANSEEQIIFGENKKDKLTAECRECPWLRFCNGACPKDRYGVSESGEPGQYWLCSGLKRFFAHSIPVLTKTMNWIREGMSPEDVRRKAEKLI